MRAGGPDVCRGPWKRGPLHVEGLCGRRLGIAAPRWNSARLGPRGAQIRCRDRRSLSGQGWGPRQHPGSVACTSPSLLKLAPLPPLV